MNSLQTPGSRMTTDRLVGVLCLAALLGFPALSVAAEEWKIGSVVAPPHILASFVDKAAESISTATNGDVKVARHQITNEQELIQNIVRGRLEAGYVSSTGLGTLVPETGVLAIPYLWTSDAERAWVGPRYAEPIVRELLKEKGLVLARYGVAGWNNVFCKFACTKPSDLQGRKARVSPSRASRVFFDELGANGVQMPLSDFIVAIEQGVVEAGELTFGYYVTTPLAVSAPNYVTTQHSYAAALFIINQKALDGLPAKTRQALLGAFPEHDWMDKLNEEAERKRMVEFNASGKGKVFFLTDAERKAWIDKQAGAAKLMLADMGGRSKELYEAIQKGRAEFAKQKR